MNADATTVRHTVSRDTTNPAPWTVTKSHGHQPNAEQAGVGYSVAVARCYHKSDAELFASAPDLLRERNHLLEVNRKLVEACKCALHQLGNSGQQDDHSCPDYQAICAALDFAKGQP